MGTDYNELAERAERGELQVKPGTERRGADARDEGRRMLMEATGASTVEEAIKIALEVPEDS